VRRWLSAAAVVVLLGALAFWLRAYAIQYNGWINPDEAELLADARRARLGLLPPYGSYTTPTFFALWPMSLATLSWMGMPLTLPAAHALSASAYVVVGALLWVVTARGVGWLRSGIVVLPVTFFVLSSPGDFAALGTELLAVLLLVAAAAILVSGRDPVSPSRLFVVAILCGLAPWAKPHGSIVVLALAVVAVQYASFPGPAAARRRNWCVALLGLAAPSLVLGLLMAVGGTLLRFWEEPLAFTLYYGVGGIDGVGDVSLAGRLSSIVAQLPTIGVFLALSLLGLVPWMARNARASDRWPLARLMWIELVGAGVITSVAIPLFQHYLNLLLASSAVAAIVGIAMASADTSKNLSGADVRSSGVSRAQIGILALPLILSSFAVSQVWQYRDFYGEPPHVDVHELSSLCPAGSRVAVWGWSAELYALYDWIPASRYTNTNLLVWRTPYTDVYRSRYADELRAAPPQCLVNAIGPGWFNFENPDAGVRRPAEHYIDGLSGWLRRGYTSHPIALADETSIKVWVRNTR
jgi:hypothetical protein